MPTVAAIEQEKGEQNARIKAGLLRKNREELYRERESDKRTFGEVIEKSRKAIQREIANWQLDFQEQLFKQPRELIRMYIPILEYASVREVMAPFLSARLAPPWRNRFPDMTETLSWLLKEVEQRLKQTKTAVEHYHYWSGYENEEAIRAASLFSTSIRHGAVR